MGMSQEAFVERYSGQWRDFEEMLDDIEFGELDRPVDSFPRHYRRICRHLAIGRSRGYSPAVRARLEKMVERGHTILYQRHRRGPVHKMLDYAAGGFARDVRKNKGFLFAALVAFCLPFAVFMGWILYDPEAAVDILGPMQMAQFDAMYGSEGIDRHAEHDLTMFAFYIYNNVGIALRTFGAGIAAGIGSIAIMVFNGVFLGAASGYVTAAGYGDQFWPFVIGHGSFELTAIVFAGMAGLKIGAAPIWPGRRRRLAALRHAAKESVGLICGFTVMLIIAAFIEAFWSPRDFEPMVRYVVGGGLWAFVVGYFVFAGRGRESR